MEPVPLPCVHLGEKVSTCKCKRAVKYHCSVWKRCTLTPVGTSVMNCVKCRAENRGYTVKPGVDSPPVTPDSK